MLESCRYVDKVYIFEEETPYSLIKFLTPDIIVKGGDYRTEDVVGADLTEVKIFEYIDGYGDLDECNGRVGVTPEFPDGIYYYMVTDDFPYFSRCLKGDI